MVKPPERCPTCRQPAEIVPYSIWTRFLKCVKCFRVFWWDGPSLLGPKDPSRKMICSGDLIELTDAAVDQLKRI